MLVGFPFDLEQLTRFELGDGAGSVLGADATTRLDILLAFAALGRTLQQLGHVVTNGAQQETTPGIVFDFPGRQPAPEPAPDSLFLTAGWLPRSTYQVGPSVVGAAGYAASRYQSGELTEAERLSVLARLDAIRASTSQLVTDADVESARAVVSDRPFVLFLLQSPADPNLTRAPLRFARHHGDSQAANLALAQACIDSVAEADIPLPVVFLPPPDDRSHLRDQLRLPDEATLVDSAQGATLEALLASGLCRLSVSINSDRVHDSLAWGVPAVAMGPLVWTDDAHRPFPASLEEALRDLDVPLEKRGRELHYLAHLFSYQWTLDDFRNPVAVSHLLDTRGQCTSEEAREARPGTAPRHGASEAVSSAPHADSGNGKEPHPMLYSGRGRSSLIYSLSRDPQEIRRAFELVRARSNARSVVLIAEGIPDGLMDGELVQHMRGLDDPNLSESKFQNVFLHEVAANQLLPRSLLANIFSRKITEISHILDDGLFARYRPFLGCEAKVLNVFPGPLSPLDKGSQRRAFELTRYLNAQGIYTDLLVTAGEAKDLPRQRNILPAIAPVVHSYRKGSRRLPAVMAARRRAEQSWRNRLGIERPPNDLFTERLILRTAPHGIERLTELLEEGSYDTVIINYAWASGIKNGVPKRLRERVRWVCDTHDVQFIRNATADRDESRLLPMTGVQKWSEIHTLKSYDALLAISESDGLHLQEVVGKERTFLVPSGFDYAAMEVCPVPDANAPRFGFLGGPMQANVAALKLLIEQWWPAIRARWPSASLMVAGPICYQRQAMELAFLEPGVHLAGFLPTLGSFYDAIDVALCPVVVQGGLNFKSVEALMSGRLLVTTSLGARCLGEDVPAIVEDEPRRVVHGIEGALCGENADLRTRGQRWAQARFSDDIAYDPLVRLLSNG